MKKLIMLTLAGVVLAVPAAMAGDEHKDHHKGKMFEETDANGDGVISQDEFITHAQDRAQEMFAKMDANNDGQITREEKQEAHKAMKEKGKEKREDWKEKKDGDMAE